MREIKVEWFGHSCFRITKDGYAIVLDPYEDNNVPGLILETLQADEVFASHEHGDHNAREKVELRGEKKDSPFQMIRLESFHDDCCGEKRGTNIMTVLESEGIRIAHLGDIGCVPSAEQMEVLQGLDAVMVPVGGFYTMEPDEIRELLKELDPRVIIPMHYRSEKFGYDVIATLDVFLREGDPVVRYDTNTLLIHPDMERQTAVLSCPEQKS